MKTLLKGGTIIDGSGQERFVGDVLLDGKKIAQVEKNIDAQADKVIDCTGLVVSPGFIDGHSHNDFFYDYDDSVRFYEPFIRQGITTQITGNCGFSPFGVDSNSQHLDKVGGGLFHAKKPGSFADFLRGAKSNLYLNLVPLIGHGTTRISMSGYDSTPLTKSQIDDEMKLVDEAMSAGAFGGSFGFMYEPGNYAKHDELVAFAKKIAEYDGILTVHPRACSKIALDYPLISKPHIEIAFDEVVDIMKETGVRTEYSHLIFVGRATWGSIEPMLKQFHKLKDEGYEIGYDNYAFNYGASVITVVLPPWYMALSPEDRKKPFTNFKLKVMTNITKKLLGFGFEDFRVAYIGEGYKQYENKTVSELAREEGLSEYDMYIKLVELSNGQGRLYLDKYYSDELVLRLMQDDMSIFMTDAWVEEAGTQNGAAYQCFPYFIEKARKNNLSLEFIINKMSFKTAERYHIKDRGLLREGYSADVAVFDYDGVSVDIATPDKTPTGIKYVFVNGTQVLDDGMFDDVKAGEVILKEVQK